MTGPPKKVKGRAPSQGQPSTKTISSHQTANKAQPNAYCVGLRLRRTASRRLEVLDSSRSDPWHYGVPGERGYPDAVAHLLELGLLPAPNREGLITMWRRGGHSRKVAEFVAEAWDLAS